MRRTSLVVGIILVALTAGIAGASDTRTYDRPLESTWDEAVKAVRDADLVLLDSDRPDHRFTMRTKSWHSHKKGRVMEVELSGDHLTATVTIRAADPEQETKPSVPGETKFERPVLDGARYLREACAILEVEPERLASSRRDRETAALRKPVAAVGIERWGQRAGELARLLDEHTVAVSRWVSDAARERQTDPAHEQKLLWLDEQLSERALAAQARGELAPAIQQER